MNSGLTSRGGCTLLGVKDQALLASYGYRHCDSGLVDYWPRAQVISDLCHEIGSESSCWLAVSSNKIVGFCWGYPENLNSLELKLKIPFVKNFYKIFGLQDKVAYQDEVGESILYRGNKIAKTLVLHRLKDFISQGLQIGIVRTRKFPEPSQTFLWYNKLGYQIIAEYDDGRVIMGRKLDGLLNKLC